MKNTEASGWDDPIDTVEPFTPTVLTGFAGRFCQAPTAPPFRSGVTTSGTCARRAARPRPVPADLPATPLHRPWTCLHITDSEEDPREAC
jgi:hypothetical protein